MSSIPALFIITRFFKVIIMESNFAVTSVVFKKFDPIFHAMFTINGSAETNMDETAKHKLKDRAKTKLKKYL